MHEDDGRDANLALGVPDPLPNEARDLARGPAGVYLGARPLSGGVPGVRLSKQRAGRVLAAAFGLMLSGRVLQLPWPWSARLLTCCLVALGAACGTRWSESLEGRRIAAARESTRRRLVARRARTAPDGALSRIASAPEPPPERGLSREEHGRP